MRLNFVLRRAEVDSPVEALRGNRKQRPRSQGLKPDGALHILGPFSAEQSEQQPVA